MKGLSGKRAIVTGGGSGIGRAICQRFGEEGTYVAVFDINLAGAQETVETIKKSGGEADAFEVDITNRDAVFDAVTKAEGGDRIAEGLKRAIPMKRLAKPSDYPGIVCFLASDDADFIIGQTISVSGGLTMHG